MTLLLDVQQILEANPHHDQHGRFATGTSATFVSLWGKPKKGSPITAEARTFAGEGTGLGVKLDIHPSYTKDLKARSKEWFGRDLYNKDIASLACAPKGATVRVTAGSSEIVLRTHYKGPNGEMLKSKRSITKEGGHLVVTNHDLEISGAPHGAGTVLFARQVDTAASLGVHHISTEAAGYGFGPGGKKADLATNGYYTWARLGYNAPLGQIGVSDIFPGFKDMNDLMIRGGAKNRQKWMEIGQPWMGTFDLAKGSRSRLILDAYVRGT